MFVKVVYFQNGMVNMLICQPNGLGIKEQNNIPGSCVVTSGSSVGAIVVGGSVVAAPTDAA